MLRYSFTAALLLAAFRPAYAGVIATETSRFGGSVTEAFVTVTVLDNYHGDPSKQDWIYTITNLSFLARLPPAYTKQVGFMLFGGEPFSVAAEQIYTPPGGHGRFLLGDVSTTFCPQQCDGAGTFGLDGGPNGLLPGYGISFDFSYLNVPGYVNLPVDEPVYLAYIDRYYQGVVAAVYGRTLVPEATPVPEPRTAFLALLGLAIAAGISKRRRAI